MKITKTYRLQTETDNKLNQVAEQNGVFQSYIVESALKDYFKKYDNTEIQQQKSVINKIGI